MDEEKYLEQFDPRRDSGDWVSEGALEYAARMRRTLLPHWPVEVLVEWFHRHSRHIYDYAFLRYERFMFRKETWPLERIPGRETFADPGFCDNFSNIEARVQKNPQDWLANYMLQHHTWNTPILLLKTPRSGIIARGGWKLNYPLHLLEGHRRLSYLNALRAKGIAASQHDVWLVRLDEAHAAE